jgi:spore germination protein
MFRKWERFSKKKKTTLPKPPTKNKDEDFSIQLFSSVHKNIENIKKMLDSPSDLVIRQFKLGSSTQAAIVFIDGLVDKADISVNIMEKLLKDDKNFVNKSTSEVLETVKDRVVATSDVKLAQSMDDIMLDVLSGDTAFFVDGVKEALIFSTKGWKTRAIDEPMTEGVVRGPRDGFIETIGTNVMLVRRQIRDPNLRLVNYKVGRRAKKTAVVAYIDGIVKPELVQEVKRRMESIDTDDIMESGYIEQWIEDDFLSPFPQIQSTERPDKVTGAILQGRVAILLDGTPFALVVPVTLGQMFHSPEDYYERWFAGTLIRVLRYFAAFIAMFLPALYIALVSFHPEMIPSKLAFSITSTREGVPVPAVVEAFLMEATMELLREAGLRLPRMIGQTIGIVGGLVIGEAAVAAGMVSPIMVIVVALTAIASFSIPSYSMALSFRYIRFALMLVAAVMGLYGIIIGYIMINIHIANLKSFGVPYSTPFAPVFFRDWKDLVLRAPILMRAKRPEMLETEDAKRVDKGGKNSQ